MRKRSKDIQAHEDYYDEAFEALVDAVIENQPEPSECALEPFEGYVQQMHSKIYADSNFKVRFHKGYSMLMRELSKQVR